MTRVEIFPQAERQLQEIWLQIAVENRASAGRLLRALGSKISRLADYPRMGPRRPEIFVSARVLVERPYLVIYELEPDTDDGPIDQVSIVAIVDGRQNLTHLF